MSRTASDIARSYTVDLEAKEETLRTLGGMVEEAIAVLNRGDDLRLFGNLLHEAWLLKRCLGDKVSNGYIEEVYETARRAGAVGGKLLGAGGGGFMLLFVDPERQEEVRERLGRLTCVPFKFESSGSRIILFDPEEDYFKDERVRASEKVRTFRELASEPL